MLSSRVSILLAAGDVPFAPGQLINVSLVHWPLPWLRTHWPAAGSPTRKARMQERC